MPARQLPPARRRARQRPTEQSTPGKEERPIDPSGHPGPAEHNPFPKQSSPRRRPTTFRLQLSNGPRDSGEVIACITVRNRKHRQERTRHPDLYSVGTLVMIKRMNVLKTRSHIAQGT